MDMIFFLFPHSPSLLLITAHCVQGREPPHPISKVHERLQAQRCDPGLSMRTQYPPAQGLVQDEDMTQVNQSSSIIQSGDFCLGFKRDVRFHFSPQTRICERLELLGAIVGSQEKSSSEHGANKDKMVHPLLVSPSLVGGFFTTELPGKPTYTTTVYNAAAAQSLQNNQKVPTVQQRELYSIFCNNLYEKRI